MEDCPLLVRDGGFIRSGYSERLDELHRLSGGGKEWIARYQAEQIEATGITSLKVGFTSVFGYYLEVTNTHRDRIPPHFIRKQTLKNAERYITPELKEYEEKVLTAEDQAKELEYELFIELRSAVQECTASLQRTAATLAELDVLAGLAELAVKAELRSSGHGRYTATGNQRWSPPRVGLDAPSRDVCPNDTFIGMEHGRVLLIHGPTWRGKSTYIRQTALLVLMAQIGSFVPAHRATIGIADRIFAESVPATNWLVARVHSWWKWSRQHVILNTAASERSLIILDEIGRGTSTYDGLSLAWAIVEYLHESIGGRTLFATHYHELVELEKSLVGVRNYNVAVKEWNDELVFLHRIARGGADKSYGIHVARLAGIPRDVNETRQVNPCATRDRSSQPTRPFQTCASSQEQKATHSVDLVPDGQPSILEKIRELDLCQLTPRRHATPRRLEEAVISYPQPARSKHNPGHSQRTCTSLQPIQALRRTPKGRTRLSGHVFRTPKGGTRWSVLWVGRQRGGAEDAFVGRQRGGRWGVPSVGRQRGATSGWATPLRLHRGA